MSCLYHQAKSESMTCSTYHKKCHGTTAVFRTGYDRTLAVRLVPERAAWPSRRATELPRPPVEPGTRCSSGKKKAHLTWTSRPEFSYDAKRHTMVKPEKNANAFRIPASK